MQEPRPEGTQEPRPRVSAFGSGRGVSAFGSGRGAFDCILDASGLHLTKLYL